MFQIGAIHINTDRPEVLGDFYGKVFDAEPEFSSEMGLGFLLGGFRLEILSHDQVSGKNPNPARSFFDIFVDDVPGEFDRIVGLGASVVQKPYEFADDEMNLIIATLADPDGNYFQLISMG